MQLYITCKIQLKDRDRICRKLINAGKIKDLAMMLE